MAKVKLKNDTLPLYVLDCLNSFDFQRYPTTTMFALTQDVAEFIWSILFM